jgi:ABC-type molybdate transport system substrate-binding protein
MTKLPALLLLFAGAFATAQEITVAAAADMGAALPELGAACTKKTGQTVKLSFGASGNLTNQIRNGASFDVLFSADEQYPQQLITEGLALKNTLYRYAIGRLVLWLPNGSPPQTANYSSANHTALLLLIVSFLLLSIVYGLNRRPWVVGPWR